MLRTLTGTLAPGAFTSTTITLVANGSTSGNIFNLAEIYNTSGYTGDIDSTYNTNSGDNIWNTGTIDNDTGTVTGDHHDGATITTM